MKTEAKFKPKELFVVLVINLAVLTALFYLASHTNLPIPLLAALTLFLYMTFLTFKNYQSMNRARKAGFLGLSISFAVLSILFAVKYYVIELEINIFHIVLIVFPPILLSSYIERKEKVKDEGSHLKS